MSIHVPSSATSVSRYYFNLVRDGERITDDRGVVLQAGDFGRDAMLRVVQSLRTSEPPELVEDWRGWSLEIADEVGQIVEVIPL